MDISAATPLTRSRKRRRRELTSGDLSLTPQPHLRPQSTSQQQEATLHAISIEDIDTAALDDPSDPSNPSLRQTSGDLPTPNERVRIIQEQLTGWNWRFTDLIMAWLDWKDGPRHAMKKRRVPSLLGRLLTDEIVQHRVANSQSNAKRLTD